MSPKRRYCVRCLAVTDRRPNGRCAPCQRAYNREYMRTWVAPNDWLEPRATCPTCKRPMPRKR